MAAHLRASLDHVVLGAANLATATASLEARLAIDFAPGGEHPLMATHNRLLRLGDDAYLEIIAVNSSAQSKRPRWFSLDSPDTMARLSAGPAPLCWVLGVSDIRAAVDVCGYDPGRIITMSRGDLQWQLTIADDGSLAGEGVLPVLIEWPGGRNPASRLPETSVRLGRLALTHPQPVMVEEVLNRLGAGGIATVSEGAPMLAFYLETPHGTVVLDGQNT